MSPRRTSLPSDLSELSPLSPRELAPLLREGAVLLDVRTPSEFRQGHIPGALSFPLFSNEERAEVGTLYSQKGGEPAFLRGLELVGPRMAELVREARRVAPHHRVAVYCWRGGQRSGSVGWLLQQAGFQVRRLTGGYRAWRAEQRKGWEEEVPLLVLGGRTGCGKSELLRELKKRGEPVVDLEQLANHRGSALGGVGLGEQPICEEFGNLLGEMFRNDRRRPFWTEDESRNIGKVGLPPEFWILLSRSPIVVVERPRAWRSRFLAEEYSAQPIEELRAALKKLEKRLGSERMNRCLNLLNESRFVEAADLLLDYYDAGYDYALKPRADQIAARIDLGELSVAEAADRLIAWKKSQKKLEKNGVRDEEN